jgi:SAM-dependent MidA family methyltransferase
VGLDAEGRLAFFAGAGSADAALLPPGADAAPQGSLVELAPARSALMLAIAERLAMDGGAGLFIDYGHLEPGFGDTLQAVRAHAYEDVLADPGGADLTAHVDFAALAAVARSQGVAPHMATQGNFLLEMGLLERAGNLGANADMASREKISAAVERLAGPQAMGELFKVMAVLPMDVEAPGFRR